MEKPLPKGGGFFVTQNPWTPDVHGFLSAVDKSFVNVKIILC
jgi:hypothetical protein